MTGRRARIISVGDELLCGRTVDTNAHDTQKRLLSRGVPVDGVNVVLDTSAAIAAALDATPEGSLVIITGGLGPTPDDLTVDAFADWSGLGLKRSPSVTMHLKTLAADRGFPYGPHMDKQTRVPDDFTAVINPAGTAPGLVGEARGRVLVLLPGVPSEVEALWPGIEADLEARSVFGPPVFSLLRRTSGLSEPALTGLTEPVRALWPDLTWSWWLTRWGVDVQASAAPGATIPEGLAQALDEVLGTRVYAEQFVELNQVVQDLLKARGSTIAVAESCTGGLLGAALTDLPGSSAVFCGGVLAYQNEIKERLLGVPGATLAVQGAVSSETAEAMAEGARRLIGADYALAVTGIAGPDGGTDTKPVGTTWLALAGPEGVWSHCERFRSHRARNRRLTVARALDALRRHLQTDRDPWTGDGS